MSVISDRDLVLQTRRGKVQAYGQLVSRYQTTVFNTCYRLMSERRDAEDLAQETFIRAYQRLETFDEDRPFGPWIRRIAANLCINQMHRSDPPTFDIDEDRDGYEQSRPLNPEATIIGSENKERIWEAILGLPFHYRVVIELRHFLALSYAEISTVLGVPLSDVKSHLFRARRLLAERLSYEKIR
jgi:RNA polymerase sigma-70 factor (ECF subfamily)